MPPGKFRFAIVGCGYVADNYMFAFGQYPEAEMLRAFDIVPEHAARFTAHWGVPSVTTMAEFLDGLEADLVLNLTNPGAHFEVSKALLEAGFPVYSEKPLGMRFEEVEALAALAAGRGLALAGAPCNHLAEAADALRRALDQDRIGRPLLAYAEVDDKLIAKSPVETWRNLSGAPWPFEDEFRVGCTLEHAGYYLTWLVAAFGPIESVTAFAGLQYPGKPVGDGVEGPDFSVAALKFASGMAARLTCSVIAPKDRRGLLVLPDPGALPALDAHPPPPPAQPLEQPGAARPAAGDHQGRQRREHGFHARPDGDPARRAGGPPEPAADGFLRACERGGARHPPRRRDPRPLSHEEQLHPPCPGSLAA